MRLEMLMQRASIAVHCFLGSQALVKRVIIITIHDMP